MISFVLCSRNDGYGNDLSDYKVDGISDFNMARLRATIDGIGHLRKILSEKIEVILVDCFPPDGNLTLTDIFCNDDYWDYVRVVEIPTKYRDTLYSQTTYRMPIYEYLAKHVGSYFCKNDVLMFTNSDVIFRSAGISKTCSDAIEGKVCRAYRVGLDPRILLAPDSIRGIIETGTWSGGSTSAFPAAAGDYIGISMQNYVRTGGFRLCHGEWDVDNEFLGRCKMFGCGYENSDIHYHIDHYSKSDPHSTTPNRAPRVSGSEHRAIGVAPQLVESILRDAGLFGDTSLKRRYDEIMAMPTANTVIDESAKKQFPVGWGPTHTEWNNPGMAAKRNKWMILTGYRN